MKKEYEIQKTLCVSSAHLPKEQAEKLTSMGLQIEQSQYCYILHITLDDLGDDDEYCIEVKNLMQLAKDLGCSWIKFDRDGPTLEDFPVFEW